MQRLRIILSSYSGSALVVTLLVLLAVTILGVLSINTSEVEMSIARNEREVRQSFYLAEGAAMEGIQRLLDTSDIDLNEQHLTWHHGIKEIETRHLNFRNPANWDADGQGRDNAAQSPMDVQACFAAVEKKVATGGSLIQTNTRLYQNRVYGLCTEYQTDSLVEIGYYMRY